MAFNKSQVENVMDGLDRALTIHAKIVRLNALGKIEVDENADLEIPNGAQLTAYLALLVQRRDNIIAAVKPVVSGW